MISGDCTTSNLIAGAFSGAVATGVTAPLELVKTIQQSNATPARVALNIVGERMKTEGVRAMFRGLTASLAAIAPHQAVFFSLYNYAKTELNDRGYSRLTSNIAASSLAGAAANIVTNPLWVVKTRMSNEPWRYRKFVQSTIQIVRAEGLTALTAGMGLSILSVGHVVIQFPLYEDIKSSSFFEDPSGTTAIFAASCGSKVVASLVTHPLDTIRTQMQQHGERGYKAADERRRIMFHNRGISGFYAGFGSSIAKAVPSTFITLWLVEHFSKFFDNSDAYIHSDSFNYYIF